MASERQHTGCVGCTADWIGCVAGRTGCNQRARFSSGLVFLLANICTINVVVANGWYFTLIRLRVQQIMGGLMVVVKSM